MRTRCYALNKRQARARQRNRGSGKRLNSPAKLVKRPNSPMPHFTIGVPPLSRASRSRVYCRMRPCSLLSHAPMQPFSVCDYSDSILIITIAYHNLLHRSPSPTAASAAAALVAPLAYQPVYRRWTYCSA